MMLQGKGGNLSERQAQFAQDILSSYQMLTQINEWKKQYLKGPAVGATAPAENNPELKTK
jgi:hypothetical protein